MTHSYRYRLPPVLFLWIPVLAMVCQIIMEMTLSGPLLSQIHSENSLHETIEAAFMVFAFFVALSYFFTKTPKTSLLSFWFGIAALGSFYIAGEEISWGQHILDWKTSEEWAAINDQGETNLHNTSSWLDQKPRLLLLIGIICGCFIFPILKNREWVKFPTAFIALFPPKELNITAAIIIISQIIEKAFESVDIAIFARYSEVQELYMFYFIVLYLVWLRKNLPDIVR